MKNLKENRKAEGERGRERENERRTDRSTQRYKGRVKMERERSYARLLGKPNNILVVHNIEENPPSQLGEIHGTRCPGHNHIGH